MLQLTGIKDGLELEDVLLRVFGRLLLLPLVCDVRLTLRIDLGFLLRRLRSLCILRALLIGLWVCEWRTRKEATPAGVRPDVTEWRPADGRYRAWESRGSILFEARVIIRSYPSRCLCFFIRCDRRVLFPVHGWERDASRRVARNEVHWNASISIRCWSRLCCVRRFACFAQRPWWVLAYFLSLSLASMAAARFSSTVGIRHAQHRSVRRGLCCSLLRNGSQNLRCLACIQAGSPPMTLAAIAWREREETRVGSSSDRAKKKGRRHFAPRWLRVVRRGSTDLYSTNEVSSQQRRGSRVPEARWAEARCGWLESTASTLC